jgi:putative inorganic carbon (hco3(-)) transporter
LRAAALARAGGTGSWLPAAAVAAALGTGLLAALYLGPKWLALAGTAYLSLAGLAVARDRRLLAVFLISACIPIGFQYNLWTHGNKFVLLQHFGGAPPEPVVFLVDLPLLLLSVFWLGDLRAGRKALPSWTATETLAVAFIGVSLLSLFNTEEYGLVLFETVRYVKYFLVYLMLRTYLDGPIAFWAVLAAQISVLSIQGLVSAMQYFRGFELPIPVGGVSGIDAEMVGNELVQRVTGVLGHCNTFSAYLSAACAFCLIVLFARVRTWVRLAVLPFLVSGLIALVLTFSRNGWMVFAINAVGISAWALYTRRLKLWMIGALALLCFALVGGLAASGVLDTMFTRVFRTDGREFDSRWDLALVAWEMIRSHPVLGIGLNTFEESMIRFDPNHITHIIRQPVHNGFLLVTAETGAAGLILLLALLWRQIRAAARILKGQSETHFAVGLAGMAVFAGLAIANLFDVPLRKEAVVGLIVLTAAMLASMPARAEDTAVADPSFSPAEAVRS